LSDGKVCDLASLECEGHSVFLFRSSTAARLCRSIHNLYRIT
jgi:hypothetical protein